MSPDWYRWGFPSPGVGRDSDGYICDCPRCGLPVYEHGQDLNAAVWWEGRESHGHLGCLGDLQYERDRDDPSIGSRAFSDAEYERELHGGV